MSLDRRGTQHGSLIRVKAPRTQILVAHRLDVEFLPGRNLLRNLNL